MSDVESDGRRLDRNINIPESENVYIPAGNSLILTVAMLTHVHALILVVGTSHLSRYVIWHFAVKCSDVIFLYLEVFFLMRGLDVLDV